MKVLVVGGGGREHAIVEALRRSQADIYAAMSNHNPGIRRRSKDVLLGDVTDVERIVSWAKGHGIELAVIGPEAPLGNGITDALEAVAIPTVGPSREAAQLETNKEFTRALMQAHQIPGVPQFWAFDDLARFEEFVNDSDFEFVIKPLGLTGGKGVRVWGDHFSSKAEALAARGTPFKGILYGGFMATKDGPILLEYNVRFADPESMNVLPILETDFLDVCSRITAGALPSAVSFARRATVCKYVVPMGYGSHPKAGEQLKVDEESIRRTGAKLYYASVDEKAGHLYTTTSRSLAIVGIASNLADAESISEEALAFVSGSFYARRDIGKPEVTQRKVERMRKIREGH